MPEKNEKCDGRKKVRDTGMKVRRSSGERKGVMGRKRKK